MGDNTTASGNFTTAMGRNASTNGLSGSFVYGDATTSGIVNATAANFFTVRAAGGTTFYSNAGLSTGVSLASGGGAWASVSDRNRKENFRDEDGEAALAKIAALPIQSWSYKSQAPSIRHWRSSTSLPLRSRLVIRNVVRPCLWLPTLTVPAYRLRQHRQSTGQGRARSA